MCVVIVSSLSSAPSTRKLIAPVLPGQLYIKHGGVGVHVGWIGSVMTYVFFELHTPVSSSGWSFETLNVFEAEDFFYNPSEVHSELCTRFHPVLLSLFKNDNH